MAHDFDQSGAWEDKTLRVKDKRNPGTWLNEYSRAAWQQAMRHPVYGYDYPADETPYLFTHRFEKLTEIFPIDPGDRILLVSEGVGYLQEAFRSGGYANCWEVQPFTYLQGHTDVQPGIVIMKKDLRGGNTIEELQTEFTAQTGEAVFDWIITDNFVQRLSDAHLGVLATNLGTFLDPAWLDGNMIHLTVPEIPGKQDPDYYFRTLAALRAIMPTHTIVSTVGNWEVY